MCLFICLGMVDPAWDHMEPRSLLNSRILRDLSHSQTDAQRLHDHVHLWTQLERVMKSLFLRRLFIWPRYEAGVKSTLEGHECEVRHRSVQHLHYHTCHCLPSQAPA